MGRGLAIAIVALVIVAAGVGGWYVLSGRNSAETSAIATVPTPEGAEPAQSPASSSTLGTPSDPIIPKEAAGIQFPPECVVPGPVPVLPRGAVATMDDMKVAHTAIQGFVNALEGYQACLEKHIKDDAKATSPQTRQVWRTAGNRAIDASHMLADDYAKQYKVFKARQPDASPATAP